MKKKKFWIKKYAPPNPRSWIRHCMWR